MKSTKLPCFCSLLCAFLLLCAYVPDCASQVQIDIDGLSDKAQDSIKRLSNERTLLKNEIEEPLGQLKKLQETYRAICGSAAPSSDSGCTDQFNQIIGAYNQLLTKVSGFVISYNRQLETVVKELEPQIADVGLKNSASELVDDLLSKYEEEDYIDDPLISALESAFLLDQGATALETVSEIYMQYSQELGAFKSLQQRIQRRVLQAQQMQNLSPILNEETQKELAGITTFIQGGKPTTRKEQSPRRRIAAQ